MTCKTTKNSYKMLLVMKPGPNVSIELLKSISTQKAHKTCHKQGSKLHYLGTNHLCGLIAFPSSANSKSTSQRLGPRYNILSIGIKKVVRTTVLKCYEIS